MFFSHPIWCWGKKDNSQKFRGRRNNFFVNILIYLVFFKLGIQYLWEGEISVCKVVVPIKEVLVKNDYFLHTKFELRRYQKLNEFLFWCSFYWKRFDAYISHNLIVRLIPTWIWYDLFIVSQVWSSNHLLSYCF